MPGEENEVSIRVRLLMEDVRQNARGAVDPRARRFGTFQRQFSRDQSEFGRFEHRLERRMQHLGARLVASNLVGELGDSMGIEDRALGRIGTHAITGLAMGNVIGAGVGVLYGVVHELAHVQKEHQRRMAAIEKQQREDRKRSQEDRIEIVDKLKEREKELQDAIRKERIKILETTSQAIYETSQYIP